MTNIFKIKRGERAVALIALIVSAVLNALMVAYHHDIFTRGGKQGYWTLFANNFHVSGFDMYTYLTVTKWDGYFTEYRHPLLSYLWYPFYLINDWQMDLTGKNIAIYLVAVVMTVTATYSAIFLFRTLREIVGLKRGDSALLCFFFFSFAYIMLSVMVPDHFGLSLFLLTMTLYIAGKLLQANKPMPIWQCALLFVLTAGVTLSNGVKTFLCALFTNGKRFFRLRFLTLAVVLPTLFIGGMAIVQKETLITPHQEEGQRILEKRMAKDSVFRAKVLAQRKHSKTVHGETLGQTGVLAWFDLSVSRSQSLVENVFGESIILHRDHLLGDVLLKRPIFVTYSHPAFYVVEILIVLLFLLGLWCGRYSRFLWMTLGCVAFDAVVHFLFGFGLNEVYIMTAHWAFVIPLAVAFLFRHINGRILPALRWLTGLTACFLFAYNGWLIFYHLILR